MLFPEVKHNSALYEWLLSFLSEGVLKSPSLHDTQCDGGGSRGGKTQPEKTPSSNDATVGFQQTQEEKPNNTIDSTTLRGTVTRHMHPTYVAYKGASTF